MKKTLLLLTILAALVLSLASCALLQKLCKHQYNDTVVDPTCATEGYTDHVCTKCGYSYQDTTTQKLAHLYKSVVTSPTCLEEGYTTHTCTECGDTYQDTVTRKLHHDYESVVTAPTCIAEGYTTHNCTECDNSYVDTVTQKLPHPYYSVVNTPTCTEEGYTEHICTVCSNSYRDTIVAKIAHDYASVVTPANCTAEGYTTYTCSSCADTYNDDITPKTSHRFNGAPCTYCSMEEITENITPDTEWYNIDSIVFTIKTAEQLAGLASLVNEGIVTSDQIFYLDADIDLGFYEWIPIGTAEHPFNATFKGEGYTISSLKINADYDYVGLFGKIVGKVERLNVMNASVYVKNPFSYVGIFAGYVKNEINSVNVSGYVDAKLSSYVGGIAGYAEAQIQKSSSATEVSGYDYVGGIAGAATPGSSIYSYITINGSVTGNNYVGGMIGHLSTSSSVQTDNITSTANVSGVTYVGGILGFASAKTDSKLYNASVCAEITGDYYVGGLIGKTTNVTIDNCTNEGSTVIANSYLTENDAFYVYLGGYVGYGYIVTNCTNAVDISYNSRGSYIGGIAGYLTNAISKCENSASIFGKDCVGGLVGKLDTSSAITVSDLKNTGNVSGAARIGGIVGHFNVNSKVNITLSKLENCGIIYASASDVGGIVGCYNYGGNMEHTLTAADLKNTGDVNAEYNTVGGLFGYVGAANGSSIIKNSTSSANITGSHYVGGLIGSTNIAISSCSNEGSTITATGWYTEGSTDYVWLGGYVGYGYKVSGCTNNSDITYSGTGNYVGGIIGCASGEIQNCTNNGDISSTGAHVGGIAGYVTSSVALNFKNLENTGDISGRQRVGGIIGDLVQQTSEKGATALNKVMNSYDCTYYHMYKTETKISNATNSGNVTAYDEWGYAGGIIGLVQLSSNYSTGKQCCSWRTYYNCKLIGCFTLSASNLTNTGMISGRADSGELFGYHSSDGEHGVTSSITNYTVTGQIELNDEILEGSYDTGYTTADLTLSGREIYTPPVVETPEETPEDGAETTPDGETEGETESGADEGENNTTDTETTE